MTQWIMELIVTYMRKPPERREVEMLVKVIAEFECDKCGNREQFDIDAAYKPPAGWSVHDLALDATRCHAAGFVSADGSWICTKCDEAVKAGGGG